MDMLQQVVMQQNCDFGLEKMKEQKGYSKKLGLENASTIHGKKMNCDIKTMIEKGT